MKRIDYQPGDKVSRRDAWLDLKWDFSTGRFFTDDEGRSRFGQFWHTCTGTLVNLWRLAGVSDRDTSQTLGRWTWFPIACAAVVALL